MYGLQFQVVDKAAKKYVCKGAFDSEKDGDRLPNEGRIWRADEKCQEAE